MGLGDAELDAFGPGGPVRPGRAVVRFSAVGEAWALFLAQAGSWLLAGVLVMVGNWLVLGAISSLFGHRPRLGGFWLPVPSDLRWYDVALVSVVNGFFLGGMFRMACRQVRGGRAEVGDLFSVTDVLPQLALGSLLYALICSAAAVVCLGLPGLIAAGVLMFSLPLIVDARLDAVEALRRSWLALKGEWIGATLFQVVLQVMVGAGACCLCLGMPLTMPLYCLSVAVLYRDAMLRKGPAGMDKPLAPDPLF
jgi:hypothetical protein